MLKVSNVFDAEKVEKEWLEMMVDRKLDVHDGVVRDSKLFKWLDSEANDFLVKKGFEFDFKKKNNNGSYYRDIDRHIEYNRKKCSVMVRENGDEVRVGVGDISLDADFEKSGDGYNIASIVKDFDCYSIVEDKLLAKDVISKFKYVDDEIVKRDKRRVRISNQIMMYLVETDKNKRSKLKKRLKDTLSLELDGIRVEDVVKDVLQNCITRGLLLDKDFDLKEYLSGLEVF